VFVECFGEGFVFDGGFVLDCCEYVVCGGLVFFGDEVGD